MLSSNDVYTSPGTSVTVRFVSNSSLERSGFELRYRAGQLLIFFMADAGKIEYW